jgi:hypothetical protein
MGGTLYHDRSDTRRSLSTTRQENGAKREQPVECRTTTMILRIDDIRFFLSYDPPNPEHEATGRVPWVNLTIYVNILFFTWGLGSSSRTKYRVTGYY